ncbi:Protein SRC2 [Cardamine amara subsp. amara]|uniref:Protein SRC2 n=1 Tax=Cardamine amara subsp. amara TaxID=228776 RepID=A0ABD1BTN9_CARAN
MSPPELQRAREKNPILELKIISASDVGHIILADKMDVYAIVSLTGDNIQKKQAAKTPIDFYGGSNPTWNHSVKFSVNEEAARLSLKVKLFSYWLKGEKDLYLGEVNVSVHELLGSNPLPPLTNGNDSKLRLVIYPLKITDVTKGTLSFSYRFNQAVLPVNIDHYPSAPDYSLSYGQPINPNPDPASSSQPVMYSPQCQTTTTKLTLQLMIKSAKDISKVNIGNEMNVYASVMIHEHNKPITDKTKTPVVYCAYRNPRWDHEVKFCLKEKLVREGLLTLTVKLIGVRTFLEDKVVGEVKVPIQELFDFNPPSLTLTNVGGGGDDNGMILVTRGVNVLGSYGDKGTLSFKYRFLAEQVPQPFIMYPIHGTSGYTIAQPGANAGSRNGQMPIYMQPQYNQQYSPPQLQPQPQKSLSQLQQPLLHTQSQSQSLSQTEGERPTTKPQGGSIAAVGLGAAIVGRVIGGALMG